MVASSTTDPSCWSLQGLFQQPFHVSQKFSVMSQEIKSMKLFIWRYNAIKFSVSKHVFDAYVLIQCHSFVCQQVGVTHYFSFLKAKEELGYVPMVTPREGMTATISYWQEKKRKGIDGPTIYAWLFSLIGMPALFSVAWLPDIVPVPFLRTIGLFIFRSMWMIRVAFFIALLAHVSEAICAWYLAKRADPANARGWFWQTLALGMFSLRFLLRRARK